MRPQIRPEKHPTMHSELLSANDARSAGTGPTTRLLGVGAVGVAVAALLISGCSGTPQTQPSASPPPQSATSDPATPPPATPPSPTSSQSPSTAASGSTSSTIPSRPPIPTTQQPTYPSPSMTRPGTGKPMPTQTLTGVVSAGVENGCLLLKQSMSPTSYLLVGGDRSLLRPGATVQVTGRVNTEMASYCQQGILFEVDTVNPVPNNQVRPGHPKVSATVAPLLRPQLGR